MGSVDVSRRDNGVAVVTLNDPDRRNALTEPMGHAFRDLLTRLAGDGELRCVIVTGAGEAFSSGGDLGMLEEHARAAREDGADLTATMRGFYDLFLAVQDLPVPVVAAVNGAAVGAGLCLALACDLVVVAEDAKVGMTFLRIGLHPGMAATWSLPRLVGRQRAAELLYTGRIVSGAEAASWGMALEAVPAAEVLPRAEKLAENIAGSAPLVVRQLKVSLRETWRRPLPGQLDLEASYQARNYSSRDLDEGISAVRQDRTPRFEGR